MKLRLSPFARGVRLAKRVTPGWLAYLVVFLVCVFIVQFGVLNLLASLWPVSPGSATAAWQEALAGVASLAALFLWVGLFERRWPLSVGFASPRQGVIELLAGVVCGLMMVAIPVVVLWGIGAYVAADAPPSGSSGWTALPVVGMLIVAVMMQAANEETLVRGFLLQNQAAKVPGWLALLLPALCFTVLHGVTNTPVAFVTLMAFALFASFLVLLRGTLWAAIGFHTGWNLGLGSVFGIPVSGLPAHTESILYVAPAPGYPDWITGGAFGTEASVFAAALLLLAAAVSYAVLRRRSTSWSVAASADD